MPIEQIDMSEARCLGCGYQLRGLDHNRCPECGREFDPDDPDSMKLPGRSKPRWWLGNFGTEMVKLASAATLFTVIPIHLGVPDERWTLLYLYGALMWFILVAACIVGWILMRRLSRRQKQREGFTSLINWRLVVAILLVVSLSSQVYYDTCPHATYFTFGGIGLAYSRSGGPCRNYARHGNTHIAGKWYLVCESPIRDALNYPLGLW